MKEYFNTGFTFTFTYPVAWVAVGTPLSIDRPASSIRPYSWLPPGGHCRSGLSMTWCSPPSFSFVGPSLSSQELFLAGLSLQVPHTRGEQKWAHGVWLSVCVSVFVFLIFLRFGTHTKMWMSFTFFEVLCNVQSHFFYFFKVAATICIKFALNFYQRFKSAGE